MISIVNTAIRTQYMSAILKQTKMLALVYIWCIKGSKLIKNNTDCGFFFYFKGKIGTCFKFFEQKKKKINRYYKCSVSKWDYMAIYRAVNVVNLRLLSVLDGVGKNSTPFSLWLTIGRSTKNPPLLPWLSSLPLGKSEIAFIPLPCCFCRRLPSFCDNRWSS